MSHNLTYIDIDGKKRYRKLKVIEFRERIHGLKGDENTTIKLWYGKWSKAVIGYQCQGRDIRLLDTKLKILNGYEWK